MPTLFNEPIVIGYVCSGPTYRESVYNKLKNFYFDDDNLFYCIITDDKKFFSYLNRKNLIVKELTEFYKKFLYLEKYEYFLNSVSVNDYGEKFINRGYKFPMSVYRFILFLAHELKIRNVTLLGCDSYFDIYNFNNGYFNERNVVHVSGGFEVDTMYCGGYKNSLHPSIFLEKKYNYNPFNLNRNYNIDNVDVVCETGKILIVDEAARFYFFKDVTQLNFFFNLWNDIIEFLCLNVDFNHNHSIIYNYDSGIFRMNEWVVAPIHEFLNFKFKWGGTIGLRVEHDPIYERRFLNL